MQDDLQAQTVRVKQSKPIYHFLTSKFNMWFEILENYRFIVTMIQREKLQKCTQNILALQNERYICNITYICSYTVYFNTPVNLNSG